MTPAELQNIILSGPHAAACAAYVHTNEMTAISGMEARAKDQAIADTLNAVGAVTRVDSRPIGLRTVLDVLGPEAGAAVLDALYALAATARPVHYALKLLEQGGLDIGMGSTRAQVDALVGVALSAEQAVAIKALAETREIITAAQIGIALRGPWE